jgi:hypothetical protein
MAYQSTMLNTNLSKETASIYLCVSVFMHLVVFGVRADSPAAVNALAKGLV